MLGPRQEDPEGHTRGEQGHHRKRRNDQHKYMSRCRLIAIAATVAKWLSRVAEEEATTTRAEIEARLKGDDEQRRAVGEGVKEEVQGRNAKDWISGGQIFVH
jgi:hypothetical protein